MAVEDRYFLNVYFLVPFFFAPFGFGLCETDVAVIVINVPITHEVVVIVFSKRSTKH